MEDPKRSKEAVSDQETGLETGLFNYSPPPPSSRESDQPLAEALSYLREAVYYSVAKIHSRKVPVEEKAR